MSTKDDLRELFSTKRYCRLIPFFALLVTANLMPVIILPAFGANWFSDCKEVEEEDGECKFNYIEYNFYSSLFSSITGSVTFIFSGFAGSLSDKYGRKLLIYCSITLLIICNGLMIIYVNLFVYWSLQAFVAIFAMSTVLQAYISDIIPKQSLKTLAYSMIYAVASVFVLIGSVLGYVIGTMGTDSQYIWMSVTGLNVLLLLYTVCFIKETKSSQENISQNPIKALFNLFFQNSNPIILWVSIIESIVAVPSSFMGVLIVFISDSLSIDNEKDSYLINTIFLTSMAVSAIITAAIILPLLRRFEFATDLNIVMIGVCFVTIGQFIFSFVPYIDNNLFVSIGIVVAGSFAFSFFSFIGSALNSVLTKHTNPSEHGLAFGIMHSCAGVTEIFAPFTFGYGYNLSKSMGAPSLMLYIIAGLMSVALIILIFPLRSTIKRMDAANKAPLLETDLRTEHSSIQSYLSFDRRMQDSNTLNNECSVN